MAGDIPDPAIPDVLRELAEAVGGTINHVSGPLPDGSGFATMSMPLPADHWLTRKAERYEAPPMPFRMGAADPRREPWAEAIRAAGRYALRAATLNGTETDFDPDAFLQNLVVGMLGYWTTVDGLSEDAWANPDPVPDNLADRRLL